MSSANPKVHEPSMEEILASIRRIISDDQDGLRGPLSPIGPDRSETGLEAADREEPPATAEGDDAVAQGSQPANDFAPDRPEHRPLDLGRPVSAASETRPLPNGRSGLSAASLPLQEPIPEPKQTADTLLSDAVSASLLDAFGRLEPDVRIGSARTLEDLVQDMLRPMLKAWLDDHLPPLVERLIQAEIQRITRSRR